MKSITFAALVLISIVLTSCSNKLNNGKATDVLKQEIPLDTAWETTPVNLQSFSIDYLKSAMLIKEKPPTVASTPGADGMGVPSQSLSDGYEFTDMAKSLIVNGDIHSNVITTKTFYIVDYNIKSIYFETEGSNQAEVEFEVNYARSAFSGQESRCTSMCSGGGSGGTLTCTYPASFYKTIKCVFKKYESGWGIDNKEQIANEIKSLNGVIDDPSRCGKAISIDYRIP